MNNICVIGGGAAGLTASYFAAINGADVVLVEKNGACGRKLNITGKGRCNLTNCCDISEFLKNVPTNPRFLYKALNTLDPEGTMALFQSFGVPLKTERGRRVFPISDKASDVTDALTAACRGVGVRFVNGKVTGIDTENGAVTGVLLADGRRLDCQAAIVATGGASYPKTGSDGDGYRFAKALGHSVTPILPSLVPLASDDGLCAECMGLSLKNVGVGFYDAGGKLLYYEQGEMIFTHFGISGPVVLSASAHLGECKGIEAVIDLKPALDAETLDRRLLRDFEEAKNKDFANSLSALLPQKLISVIVCRSGIDPHKKVNSVTRAERRRLSELLKGLSISITGKRPIDEAIITSGGVSVKEINPSTMASKLVSGLYFAGEVIDVDAYTGGYNLQIAFSTGALAGESAARQ